MPAESANATAACSALPVIQLAASAKRDTSHQTTPVKVWMTPGAGRTNSPSFSSPSTPAPTTSMICLVAPANAAAAPSAWPSNHWPTSTIRLTSQPSTSTKVWMTPGAGRTKSLSLFNASTPVPIISAIAFAPLANSTPAVRPSRSSNVDTRTISLITIARLSANARIASCDGTASAAMPFSSSTPFARKSTT